MSEKVTGYALIIAGLVITLLAAFSVYSVFAGTVKPFALFNFDGVSIPISTLLGPEFAAVNAPDVEIFPAEVLNSTSNTLAHLFLMGFIVSVGARIANIGTNLVRPIIVKMDAQRVPSVLDPK